MRTPKGNRSQPKWLLGDRIGLGLLPATLVLVILGFFSTAYAIGWWPFTRPMPSPSQPTFPVSTGGPTTNSTAASSPAFLTNITPYSGAMPDAEGMATVNGAEYTHVLGYMTNYGGLSTSWSLSGMYTRFTAVVALDRCEISCSDMLTKFEVVADGQTVFSHQLSDMQSLPVSTLIGHPQVLTLKMTFVKPFPGIGWWHWSDAKVDP